MPCYDYACSRCGKEFEAIVSKPDPEQTVKCPACGGDSNTFMSQGKRNVKFLFNYLAPTD